MGTFLPKINFLAVFFTLYTLQTASPKRIYISQVGVKAYANPEFPLPLAYPVPFASPGILMNSYGNWAKILFDTDRVGWVPDTAFMEGAKFRAQFSVPPDSQIFVELDGAVEKLKRSWLEEARSWRIAEITWLDTGKALKDQISLYRNPRSSSRIVKKIHIGENLRLGVRQRNWRKVFTPAGDSGWVVESLIRYLQTKNVLLPDVPSGQIIADHQVFRSLPEMSAPIIAQASKGTFLEISDGASGWTEVKLSPSQKGWLPDINIQAETSPSGEFNSVNFFCQEAIILKSGPGHHLTSRGSEYFGNSFEILQTLGTWNFGQSESGRQGWAPQQALCNAGELNKKLREFDISAPKPILAVKILADSLFQAPLYARPNMGHPNGEMLPPLEWVYVLGVLGPWDYVYRHNGTSGWIPRSHLITDVFYTDILSGKNLQTSGLRDLPRVPPVEFSAPTGSRLKENLNYAIGIFLGRAEMEKSRFDRQWELLTERKSKLGEKKNSLEPEIEKKMTGFLAREENSLRVEKQKLFENLELERKKLESRKTIFLTEQKQINNKLAEHKNLWEKEIKNEQHLLTKQADSLANHWAEAKKELQKEIDIEENRIQNARAQPSDIKKTDLQKLKSRRSQLKNTLSQGERRFKLLSQNIAEKIARLEQNSPGKIATRLKTLENQLIKDLNKAETEYQNQLADFHQKEESLKSTLDKKQLDIYEAQKVLRAKTQHELEAGLTADSLKLNSEARDLTQEYLLIQLGFMTEATKIFSRMKSRMGDSLSQETLNLESQIKETQRLLANYQEGKFHWEAVNTLRQTLAGAYQIWETKLKSWLKEIPGYPPPGTRTWGALEVTLRPLTRQILNDYQKSKRAYPGTPAVVVAQIHIDPSGKIKQTQILASHLPDPELESVVKSHLTQAQFDPINSNSPPTQVQIPFFFFP